MRAILHETLAKKYFLSCPVKYSCVETPCRMRFALLFLLQLNRQAAAAEAQKGKCRVRNRHPPSLLGSYWVGGLTELSAWRAHAGASASRGLSSGARLHVSAFLAADGSAELRLRWLGGLELRHFPVPSAIRSFACAGHSALRWRMICDAKQRHALRFDAHRCPVLLAHPAFAQLRSDSEVRGEIAFDSASGAFSVPLIKHTSRGKPKYHTLPLNQVSALLPSVVQELGKAPVRQVGSSGGASTAAREMCPHWNAMGCLLDATARTCFSSSSSSNRAGRPHFILPNAKDSVWVCCCPEPYTPCSVAAWKANTVCVAAMRKRFGPLVSDWRALKSVPTMHRAREAAQLAREDMQKAAAQCSDTLAPARPLAGCAKGGISRADLLCETYQWAVVGGGNKETLQAHHCTVPPTKQHVQLARRGQLGLEGYFPSTNAEVDKDLEKETLGVTKSSSDLFAKVKSVW